MYKITANSGEDSRRVKISINQKISGRYENESNKFDDKKYFYENIVANMLTFKPYEY